MSIFKKEYFSGKLFMIYNTPIWLFDSSPIHCCELFCISINCKELMIMQILSCPVELTSLSQWKNQCVFSWQLSSTFLYSV